MWITPEKPFIIPLEVKHTLSKLHHAGYEAYLVGGCVRDYLLGLEVKDFDLATDATPDQVLGLFEGSVAIGHFFGVVKVSGPIDIEVATFREEKNYKDHRRPSQVSFSHAAKDAERRDFTVNALFYDLKTQRVLDYVDGFRDLTNKVLRCVGDPQQRFEEDALRMLRAIRFASRLGFEDTFKRLSNRPKRFGQKNPMYGKLGLANPMGKVYQVQLQAPDGQIHGPIEGLRVFCRKHGLVATKLCAVIKGRRKSHLGWKLVGNRITNTT
jgi:hypothetical protein